MACTIQELISQCVFPDLNLIAGQNGIGNVVTAINYKDVFDGAEDFRPGELLFTSGYGLRDEGTLSSLITMLCQCDTRGLVVQTGRYVEHIPQKLIDEADRLGFPLLTLPIRIPFSDIVQTLAPLLSPQGDQTWKTAALKQAHVFLEEVLRSDGHMFFPQSGNQIVRILLLEPGNYTSAAEEKWNECFAQILSFLQANCYFCRWRKLSGNKHVFLVAHPPEHSPSVIYRLHLKFVAFFESYGTNYFLGNEYLSAPEQLNSALLRAENGLTALREVKAKRGVCTYESIRFIYMLSYLKQNSSSIILENQALQQVLHYEKLNRTSYADTLRIYLSTSCNIAKTSKILFIHRHTMIKRLEKITAISGIKLEDYYARIHMSIALMFHDYFIY